MHQATILRPRILALLSLAVLLLPGCISAKRAYAPPKGALVLKPLPKEPFWWGTSTAPFQNEDKGYAPGSKWYFKTDWDRYAEEGGAPPRGDQAVFSWSEFDKDLPR